MALKWRGKGVTRYLIQSHIKPNDMAQSLWTAPDRGSLNLSRTRFLDRLVFTVDGGHRITSDDTDAQRLAPARRRQGELPQVAVLQPPREMDSVVGRVGLLTNHGDGVATQCLQSSQTLDELVRHHAESHDHQPLATGGTPFGQAG